MPLRVIYAVEMLLLGIGQFAPLVPVTQPVFNEHLSGPEESCNPENFDVRSIVRRVIVLREGRYWVLQEHLAQSQRSKIIWGRLAVA